MHNKDYGFFVLTVAIVVILSGCTSSSPEIWNIGWRGTGTTVEPQTDL